MDDEPSKELHFGGHRKFFFYESFKMYVLSAHPLQRSRLLRTIFRTVGSRHQTVHKTRHLQVHHIKVGPKVRLMRGAATLVGRGGARQQKQKSQKEQGWKQQAKDQQQARLPCKQTLQQAATIASHDSRTPQQARTVATPQVSPSSSAPPPSQPPPACSPRASAAWRAQLWSGLSNPCNPSSQTHPAPRPRRSKLSSSSPFQLPPPLASHPQSPSADASVAPGPGEERIGNGNTAVPAYVGSSAVSAPPTPPGFQHTSPSLPPLTPLSPAAQEVILTADALLARAKRLNSRFPPPPIHLGASPHTADPAKSLTQPPTPCTRPRHRQQHQYQHEHQQHQRSAQSTSQAARQLTPAPHQTLRLADPPQATSTSTLAQKEEQIAALVLRAVDPLLQNATALASILGERATTRAAATGVKEPVHSPPLHERHQPATPVADLKGPVPAVAGSDEQSTPVYEAGRRSSMACQEVWASNARAQRGYEGVETSTPRYSPGTSALRPLPEREEPAALRKDMSWSVSSYGRGSKSAGADSVDSVFSWRQQVGWDWGGAPVVPLSKGGARRRLDLEGLPYGACLGHAPAVGVGAAGTCAAGGVGLQALSALEQDDSSSCRQPLDWLHPEGGANQYPTASATNTPTRSLQSKQTHSLQSKQTRSLQSKVCGRGEASAPAPIGLHVHRGGSAEAQDVGLAGIPSKSQQSVMGASQSAHTRSAGHPVIRVLQQQRGGQVAANPRNLLSRDPHKTSGRRSCRSSEAGVGPGSRRKKGVRYRFMCPTIAAAIKCQAAHPAARPSWKGQQAALMRRAAGLSPCAPIAAGRQQ